MQKTANDWAFSPILRFSVGFYSAKRWRNLAAGLSLAVASGWP